MLTWACWRDGATRRRGGSNYFFVVSLQTTYFYGKGNMQTRACKWKHVDGSVLMGAWGREHANGSMGTRVWWWELFSDNLFSRIMIFDDIQIFTLAWNGRSGSNYLLCWLLTDCIFLWGWKHAYGSMQMGACICEHKDWSNLFSKKNLMTFIFPICMECGTGE